jgi:hypothetical protein
MKSNQSLQIRRGYSTASDERTAVADIARSIQQDPMQLVLFFCSPAYNLDRLATELRAAFGPVPLVGCTAAGHLGEAGFVRSGIMAMSLAGAITARPFALDLSALDQGVPAVAKEINALRDARSDWHSFGLLLVDGLSCREERLTSLLYRHLPRVPMVGGSAGDDLAFKQTHVFANGHFRTNTAVFTLFHTALPFRTFKFEHFIATEHTLVVTRSDPARRVVYELNGEPAAQVYAETIGVPVEQLTAAAFSQHPFVLELGGQNYLRSISCLNPDQSLTLFCAIEDGVVLSLGRTVDPVEAAENAFQQVRQKIGTPALVIGCDCILRRLEFEGSGLTDAIGGILSGHQVFGFSTYGEQYDGQHVNQTFTGVAIGDLHAPA